MNYNTYKSKDYKVIVELPGKVYIGFTQSTPGQEMGFIPCGDAKLLNSLPKDSESFDDDGFYFDLEYVMRYISRELDEPQTFTNRVIYKHKTEDRYLMISENDESLTVQRSTISRNLSNWDLEYHEKGIFEVDDWTPVLPSNEKEFSMFQLMRAYDPSTYEWNGFRKFPMCLHWEFSYVDVSHGLPDLRSFDKPSDDKLDQYYIYELIDKPGIYLSYMGNNKVVYFDKVFTPFWYEDFTGMEEYAVRRVNPIIGDSLSFLSEAQIESIKNSVKIANV